MARIKTGIFGLDQLIEGGVRDNTAIVIVGSSGTGKTTFAMQFLMHGIENGEQGLYVTMEESPEQLMKEAEMLGWDMKKHFEKSLFFIHLKGKNFKKMIDEQIPQLVKARSDYDIKTRVVIDPSTMDARPASAAPSRANRTAREARPAARCSSRRVRRE